MEEQGKFTSILKSGEQIQCPLSEPKILDSGNRSKFDTGAVRDIQTGKGRMDLLPVDAIFALAKHYEAGCQKYGDRNWEKGIPLSRYLDSALRHAFKVLRGDTDEPHIEAAIWNLMCYLQTREWIAQGVLPGALDDLPRRAEEKPVSYADALANLRASIKP